MRHKLHVVTLAILLLVLPGFAGAGPAGGQNHEDDHGVVEREVAFAVVNQNRSATAPFCTGDGATYTIRGSLVGPAGVQAGQVDAVTLYLAGSGDASAWHFTAVPDMDHITEMAKLEHASVSVHLPGYGTSDPVDGNDLCFGTFADHAQQVIEQLRAGSYTMSGGPSPAFQRVALAGHSAGGVAAELAAVSFHGADALIVAGWAGMAPPTHMHVLRCLTEPESKQPDGPGGWAFLFTTREEFETGAHDIDPEVMEAFIDTYEQDPCGWETDLHAAAVADTSLAATVDVPVLLAAGDRDSIAPPAAVEAQRTRYELGSDDVSTLIVPHTAHMIMLERSALTFRAGLSAWLAARGF